MIQTPPKRNICDPMVKKWGGGCSMFNLIPLEKIGTISTKNGTRFQYLNCDDGSRTIDFSNSFG